MICKMNYCCNDGYIPVIQIFPKTGKPFFPESMEMDHLYGFMRDGAEILRYSFRCACHRDVLQARLTEAGKPYPAKEYLPYYDSRFSDPQIIFSREIRRGSYANNIHMALDYWKIEHKFYHYDDDANRENMQKIAIAKINRMNLNAGR